MFLHRRNGQVHFFRYLAKRLFLHAPQEKDPARLLRQLFDDRLQSPELVARDQLRLDIGPGLQELEIGDRLEGDDLAAPRIVDDEVAGDFEQIGAAGPDIRPVGRGIGAGENLGAKIVELMVGTRHLPQTRAKRPLMGQDDGSKPIELEAKLVQGALPMTDGASPISYFCKNHHDSRSLSSAISGRLSPPFGKIVSIEDSGVSASVRLWG